MEDTELNQARTAVVEKFIEVETLLNASISYYFFKRVDPSFFFKVLYDPFFSFHLRVNIFNKIVKELSKKVYTGDKEKLNRKLQSFGEIRNNFIHVGSFKFYPSKDGRTDIVLANLSTEEESITPNPKDPSKVLDFKKIYKNFLDLEKELKEEIINIYKALGGRLL